MVGASIVRDNRIIAGGYNGSIAGGVHCVDEGCYVIDNHCVRTIHAEMNALLQCAKFGVPVDGAEIYVTHFPCLQCCKALIQAGIKTIYYAEAYKNHPYAEELFEQAGVKVKQVIVDPKWIDFHDTRKAELVSELINKLAESGVPEQEIADYKQKMTNLFPAQ